MRCPQCQAIDSFDYVTLEDLYHCRACGRFSAWADIPVTDYPGLQQVYNAQAGVKTEPEIHAGIGPLLWSLVGLAVLGASFLLLVLAKIAQWTEW